MQINLDRVRFCCYRFVLLNTFLFVVVHLSLAFGLEFD